MFEVSTYSNVMVCKHSLIDEERGCRYELFLSLSLFSIRGHFWDATKFHSNTPVTQHKRALAYLIHTHALQITLWFRLHYCAMQERNNNKAGGASFPILCIWLGFCNHVYSTHCFMRIYKGPLEPPNVWLVLIGGELCSKTHQNGIENKECPGFENVHRPGDLDLS